MKVLSTIRDSDFGLDTPMPESYIERTAVRAVIFNSKGEVGLLHSTTSNYYSLPGGGVNNDEEIVDALKREADEEVGCKIKNIREFCSVEEFRNQSRIHQVSHCFIADLDGEVGESHPEKNEELLGFEICFFDMENALSIMKSEASPVYHANYEIKRNLEVLIEARKFLGV
jgi:ADP-ribose pyrophosphatase YjhB (NUDIX family)